MQSQPTLHYSSWWNWTRFMGKIQRCRYASWDKSLKITEIYVSLNEFWNIACFPLNVSFCVTDIWPYVKYSSTLVIYLTPCPYLIFAIFSTGMMCNSFHQYIPFSHQQNVQFLLSFWQFSTIQNLFHVVFKTKIWYAYAKSNLVLGRWQRTEKQQGS